MSTTVPRYQPINPQERVDCEKRAGRPLPTDDDVLQFLLAERTYALKELEFGGRRQHFDVTRCIEDRRHKSRKEKT